MVGVAQLVRAPGCGPGGRGFKSHHSPKFSGYSVVRLTRLLWEQEIGSSNLSTPTLENAKYLSTKALLVSGAFTFNDYQSLSFIPINGIKKTGQRRAPRELGPIYAQFHWDSYGGYNNIFFNHYFSYI